MIRGHICVFAFAAICLTSASDARCQSGLTLHRDVITGQVTNDSARALSGVDVIISKAPDRAFLRTLTDSSGHYEIVFEQGTGDYLVHVSAAGRETVRKRVTRVGNDSTFVVDVVLKNGSAEQLAAVHVTARKPKPELYGYGSDARDADLIAARVNGAISPDLAGNLAAMAGTVPTLLITPDGVSAGGVSSQQNSVTLNGMSFPGADIPRDAVSGVSVRTSVYDPAEGWFGGAQQSVQLGSGVPLIFRHGHVTLDTPGLQYTDRYSRELGQQFTSEKAGFGSTGFLHGDRLEYNYGVDGSRRAANGISLASAPDDVLERASIAPDSVARLLATLRGLGVPLEGPIRRTTNSASFIGKVGTRPFNFASLTRASTSWDLMGYASASRTNNIVSSPTAARGSSADATNGVASLQAHVAAYIHDIYLLDVQTAVSLSHALATPFSSGPAGVVSLQSDLGNAVDGVSAVTFGGNTAMASDLTKSTWETAANIRLFAPGSATHQIKMAADSRIDTWRQATGTNTSGTFAFNSIGDVGLNHPTSFTRTLQASAQAASVWNGFVSVGDWWNKSDVFQLLYGARLEADHFLNAPHENPAVARAFGERTDFTPSTIHVSPRIGFAYTIHGRQVGYATNAIGDFRGTPAGYLRGGIGEFRTMMSPALVGGASSRSGLGPATRTITCVGAAAPSPQWAEYAADPSLIPAECVGGSAQQTFTDAAPSIELVDRSYTAPRSWRANLVYGTVLDGAIVSLEGAYSLNLDQPGRADLNFANRPQFVTSDEGRPVYVSSAAIVSASGALVTKGSRRDDAFGQVVDDVSSLRSVNRQVTLSVAPDPQSIKGWFVTAAYTLSSTRARASGFDNSTFGSPATREWARGAFDARHRLVVQGGVTRHALTFTLFARLQSGFPFTPMVGSDVNGDGFVNDRAFIFNPATTSDPVIAAGMRSLLGSSPKDVRQCLAAQLGQAATANSCEGPWTASLNAQFDYQLKFPRTHRVTHVVLAFTNPLGGLDQALHGVSHLHGWGTNSLPNSVLYDVRGFDPAASTYRYAVNPRFGDTRPSAGIARVPFGVTLDFSIDLAPPTDRQVIAQFLNPGRNGFPGKRLDASAIKRRYNILIPDPFKAITEESDSLMLSRAQAEALQNAGDTYRAQRDTILTALSDYLAGLGDTFNAREAARRQNDALAAVLDLGHASIRHELPTILNQFQLRMLPWPTSRLYAAPPDVKGAALMSY